MKKSFILYNDQKELFEKLSPKQAKDLILKIFEYSETHSPNSLKDPLVDMAFTSFKIAIDRDSAKYEIRCKKNKENIEKRWKKKNTTV